MDVRSPARARALPDDLDVVERPRLVEGVERLHFNAARPTAHERLLAAVVQNPLCGNALLRRVRVGQSLVREYHVLLT